MARGYGGGREEWKSVILHLMLIGRFQVKYVHGLLKCFGLFSGVHLFTNRASSSLNAPTHIQEDNMIHWGWLIPTAILSCLAGMVLMSLCVISKQSNEKLEGM